MSTSREPHAMGNNSSSSSSRLNPLAREFSPATPRTSSKRKASSSAKSALSPPSSTAPSPPEPAQVVIDADQLRSDDPSALARADSAEDWGFGDFDDELEDELFGQQARRNQDMNQLGGRLRRTQRDQQTPAIWRTPNAERQSRRPAIILVQTGGSDESSCDGQAGQLPYLPLYHHSSRSGSDAGLYAVLPDHARRIQRASSSLQEAPSTVTWPKDRIPVELVELIASHLARDDIKSMRLVSQEIEQKVCRSLFRTAVVPFNTELYDMVVDETKTAGRGSSPRYKGKGKMRATDVETDQYGWRNAKEDKEGKVYQGYGLRVFQGFGPYIRRFGMSFEVLESQLSTPPGKQLLDPVDSYHGTYEWPAINYARFANLNRLEETADETSRMKAAFSNLEVVSELALSMRNGLGWLDGPDESFCARLLQHQSTVFGNSYGPKDRLVRSARDVMACLRQSVQRAAPGTNFKELTLVHTALDTPLEKIVGLQGSSFLHTRLWPTLDQGLIDPSWPSASDTLTDKLAVLSASSELVEAGKLGDVDLNPNDLKKEQKEWLLETEWAQRAFLESYILAVMDNPGVFSRITTLNLATVSSGLLPMISRSMFWDALPSLSNAIIHVSPDWRTVYKDEAGVAETKTQNPSDAVRGFYNLLLDQLVCREHLLRLNIGWTDGGENAQGMYARNAHVLPAPIAMLEQSTLIYPTNQVVFPHLQHLTLSNCWISPTMLEGFVRRHSSTALKKLTLDSVSLTSHPHPPTPAQQAQAAAAAIVNLQTQFQAQNNQPAYQVPGHLQQTMAHQQFAFTQHFQNQVQQMQQLFNNPGPGQNVPPPAPPNFGGGPPVIPMPPALVPAAAANAFIPPPLAHFPPNPQNTNINPALLNAPHWTDSHRQGSWPDVLDKISPGPVFEDYLPAPEPWEVQHPPRPETNLRTIELISCGYVNLEHNTTFDQTALLASIEPGRARMMSPWFRARWSALRQYMLDGSTDKFMGSIVQWIPQREVDAMRYAWGLRVGWRDREMAEEAEFDGFRAGGTGRVSGVIEQGMPLMTQHLPNGGAALRATQSSSGAAHGSFTSAHGLSALAHGSSGSAMAAQSSSSAAPSSFSFGSATAASGSSGTATTTPGSSGTATAAHASSGTAPAAQSSSETAVAAHQTSGAASLGVE